MTSNTECASYLRTIAERLGHCSSSVNLLREVSRAITAAAVYRGALAKSKDGNVSPENIQDSIAEIRRINEALVSKTD